MKKFLLSMLCAATAVVMLAGCGGGGEKEKEKDKDFVPKPVDGIAPLFDEGLSYYNVSPSILTEGENMHVYYTVNETAKGKDNAIAYRKGTKGTDGTWTYTEKKIVLSAAESGWDSGTVSDCDVVKGSFALNGETYSYLMAYQGNSEESEIFEIGLAAAKSAEGPFVRVGTAPVISYDLESFGENWGCGQPSLVSYDKAGKVYLFFTIGELAVQTYVCELDCADLGNIKGAQAYSSLTTEGLTEQQAYITFNDADFAIDGGTLYVVRDRNPVSSNAPNLNAAVQVASMPVADLYKNGEWTVLDDVNFLDLEDDDKGGWERVYAACIISDEYGNVSVEGTMPGLGLTVTSWDINTKEYLHYQTIVAYYAE